MCSRWTSGCNGLQCSRSDWSLILLVGDFQHYVGSARSQVQFGSSLAAQFNPLLCKERAGCGTVVSLQAGGCIGAEFTVVVTFCWGSTVWSVIAHESRSASMRTCSHVSDTVRAVGALCETPLLCVLPAIACLAIEWCLQTF